MILIHCSQCKLVVGKAEKLYEHETRGMTVLCGKCAENLQKYEDTHDIPDFLRGFMGKRK